MNRADPCRLRRLAFLLAALAFAFVTSYYSWMHNTHYAQLRRAYSSWFTGKYVLFDGYGQYTGQIRYFLDHPGATKGFIKYIHGFVHANTPLFPFLSALVTYTGLSIVWSCFAVTIASSLLCLYLFHLLLRQRDPAMGLGSIACFYSYLFHPSMLSGWSRPLPDMTATALLLGFFWYVREFEKTHRARLLVGAAIMCVAGMATKSVSYLLLPLSVILFGDHVVQAWKRKHWHVHPVILAAMLLLTAVPIALMIANPGSASMKFLIRAVRGPFVHHFKPHEVLQIIESVVLFFAVSFNAYGFVAAYGWKRGLFRTETEHIGWMGLYCVQRMLFIGFSLVYARARYGIPLAPSLLILALPGFQKLCSNPRTRWLAFAPAAMNVVAWVVFLGRL